MAHVETFTDKAPGALDGLGGLIQVCPRCGRAGVERRTAEGGRTCVHAEFSELLADGLVTVPVEACPLDPLPFDVHHPDVI